MDTIYLHRDFPVRNLPGWPNTIIENEQNAVTRIISLLPLSLNHPSVLTVSIEKEIDCE